MSCEAAELDPRVEPCPEGECTGAILSYLERDGSRTHRHVTPGVARALHAALVMFLADAPPEHERGPWLPGESPGGDPRLMKGGVQRPNYRKGKR